LALRDRKILITGSNGMLGSRLSEDFRRMPVETIKGREHLNLTNLEEARKWLSGKFYSIIIHTAAITDLRACEDNAEESLALHATIVDTLKKHCDKLIYISTIPVWNKDDYKKSVYFETKKAGEEKTLSSEGNLVIRTNLFGPSNLAEWAINKLSNKEPIDGFENSFFNPVHVGQLSKFIKRECTDSSKFSKSLCTVASDKIMSKYNFLIEVAKRMDLDPSLVRPVSTPRQQLVLEMPDELFSFKEGMEMLENDYKNRK